MNKFRVDLKDTPYYICIADREEQLFSEYLIPSAKQRKVFVVSDSNVNQLYGAMFDENLELAGKYVFEAGEKNKNFKTFEDVLRCMVKSGVDRKSLVLAFGGGVCGDLTGFAAAVYMRGVDYIQIPTTLLSMVDSSVGGKTAIDLPEGKNLVGAFYQPKSVLIDISKLKSLPDREFSAGMAEVVKYAMILDKDFFYYLTKNIQPVNGKDLSVMAAIVEKCCKLKSEIVVKDEKEDSLRAILNFGHTFGHSLEMVSGYYAFVHGEAVAVGMLMACELGVNLGLFGKPQLGELEQLLKAFKLPIRAGLNIEAEVVYQAMFSDKKSINRKINFILHDKDIGKVKIVSDIPQDLVIKAISTYL